MCMQLAVCLLHGPRLSHIILDNVKLASPLWASCYGDEDMVGRVKKLCLLSSAGPLLGRQVLRRYASYACVRWLRRLE